MNERGITLQTTIITSVLALAAAAAGIVIYNAISEESSAISENAAAADLELFSYEYYGARIALNDEVEEFETPHLYAIRFPNEGSVNLVCALIGERDPADGIYKIAKVKKAASGSVVDVYSELRCGYLRGSLNTAIDSTVGIKYVSTTRGLACIITAADALECWGENRAGQLGRGEKSIEPYYNAADRRSVNLGGEIPVAVSTNYHNTCAITASDKVFCWGSNEFSQLGNGYDVASSPQHCMIEVSRESKEIECSTTPVEITELSGQGIKQLEVGPGYNCALIGEPGSDATVKCWGRNIDSELGVSSEDVLEKTPDPTEVPELTGVTELSEAHGHTCALIGPPGFDATAKCWGSNEVPYASPSARFKRGFLNIEPPIIPEIADIESSGVKKVIINVDTTCIITPLGVVRCYDGSKIEPFSESEPFSRTGSVQGENMSIASLILLGGTTYCVVYLNNEVLCWSSLRGDEFKPQLLPDSPFRN